MCNNCIVFFGFWELIYGVQGAGYVLVDIALGCLVASVAHDGLDKGRADVGIGKHGGGGMAAGVGWEFADTGSGQSIIIAIIKAVLIDSDQLLALGVIHQGLHNVDDFISQYDGFFLPGFGFLSCPGDGS